MNISASIIQLIEDYKTNPLRFMREIGMQAQLRMLLQAAYGETCSAQIRQGRVVTVTPHVVERVQMELRVQDAANRGPEKSDVVVLRSTFNAPPITLTRYPNGSYDIVSKISLSDASAVIELKAACSADVSQRHLFRSDVSKLLDLADACVAEQACPELHFVLIDKSVGISGPALAAHMPIRDWHFEPQEIINELTDLGLERFVQNSPRIEIRNSQPLTGAFVHVWMMDHEGGIAAGAPLHRYAVRGHIMEIDPAGE